MYSSHSTATVETNLSTNNSPKSKKNRTLITIVLVLLALALMSMLAMGMKIWKIWKTGKLNKARQESIDADKSSESHDILRIEMSHGQKTSMGTFPRAQLLSNSSVMNSATPLLYNESLWQNGLRQKEFHGESKCSSLACLSG